MTFLFGPGLPILFPIALMAMIILNITYRMELAYFCRAPPVYDNKMNKTVIEFLSTAPLLYMGMGAWLYSNQQTFKNDI